VHTNIPIFRVPTVYRRVKKLPTNIPILQNLKLDKLFHKQSIMLHMLNNSYFSISLRKFFIWCNLWSEMLHYIGKIRLVIGTIS